MADSSSLEKPTEAPEVMAETSPSKPKSQEDAAAPQPRRELFIRSLPASATTESLAEHFSQSYVIKHAVVVVDPKTKQSKGYGFVTFADVDDAKAALEEFNGGTFEGKKIKVEYAQKRERVVDEAGGKSAPSAAALERKKEREQQTGRGDTQPPKLIVRNLPWSIKTPDDLALHFRSFGKVKYVTLPKKGAQLAGFGFVVLRGKKNAERALEAVNGKEVDGRTLAVDWAVEKEVWENQQKEEEEQQDPEIKEESSDVDMEDGGVGLDNGELDENVDSDEDEDDVDIKDEDDEDEDEDEDMEDDEEEEEAKEDERNASTIFIRNLPFTCDDETLYEHFTQFGPLRYARIVVDPETERPRGTGFVCFWKPENCASCVQGAPKQQDPLSAEKEKGKKGTIIKQSVLQNENADPSGRYTLDGRVLQISRAVSKSRATQLEEEGVSKRLVRDTDKRRLYLLNEGTVSSSSPLYSKLSPSEIKMREDSFKQRQNFIRKNPSLHFSLTRLSVRNIPRHVTSKDLKQLAREGIVGFAKDVKEGTRQPLSKEEMDRASEEMREAERIRKKKGVGVVRQAKIVFEGRDGSKVAEGSGAGRSRGYGFIEYYTHRHALMGLRWLNGHPIAPPKNVSEELKDRKKRLIVEFAIENAQVVKRRSEMQEQTRNFRNKDRESRDEDGEKDSRNGGSRNRDPKKNGNSKGDSTPNGKRKRSESSDKGQDTEEQNKIAKRNRIIAKKRMQRKSRK
ncbi:mRNA-binding ribosome biosynthesis protein NOP4 [Aspergillus undulatus]|uniref:mRNA-binding ribosome biosynthesis protein NOP4 n=1 Tax=Aspergillus undulatus TaxID=1810928 RepID=UPI003CCE4859